MSPQFPMLVCDLAIAACAYKLICRERKLTREDYWRGFVSVTIISSYERLSKIAIAIFFLLYADYTPAGISQKVTIPASDPDMRTCFTGPVIDDDIALESNETFTLSITNFSPATDRILPGIETTRITIIDEDGKRFCTLCLPRFTDDIVIVVRVRFTEEEYPFREESGLATVCLEKDMQTAIGFSVNSLTSRNLTLGINRIFCKESCNSKINISINFILDCTLRGRSIKQH